ncbi:DeoR family transcriptional regulator [Collibacillus ludicampi]|jgi:DeoR family fructose operon transcriptional repressor|uniref:DeoR family transcriptional regulator n=1 Tax=Collibacillus ludicampi TaxID=2771369 RepID=A0AAV4LA54_9BACL|nr:DeoR/GlpR family DNA-binding transcription regulator [Collibacillus ludicampi]GIM44714.1 DeoR family transcriptional regulator [Collibacillus ludicampi]
MLNNARQAQMKQYIQSKGTVTVQDLMDQFHVSDMTVRRDLSHLENIGLVKRVHGGAIYLPDRDKDILLSVREDSQKQEKERIAEKASSLVNDGDSVLLDAGTTTLEIAKKFLGRKNITVVTNAINIASILLQNPNIEIVMTGGDVRHSTQSLVGHATVQFLQALRVDHAFIGCSGLSMERGLMNSNMAEGEIKRTMMQIAEKVYVVADHTKFEATSFSVFASWERVDAIITTEELDSQYKDQFEAKLRPHLILV